MIFDYWFLYEIIYHSDLLLRLTGAGWGGCIVALVAKDNLQNYIESIKSEYYSTLNSISTDKDCLDSVIFPTKPGPGAQIYSVDEL